MINVKMNNLDFEKRKRKGEETMTRKKNPKTSHLNEKKSVYNKI